MDLNANNTPLKIVFIYSPPPLTICRTVNKYITEIICAVLRQHIIYQNNPQLVSLHSQTVKNAD